MNLPATHYSITLMLNDGDNIVILVAFMAQGPKKDYRSVQSSRHQDARQAQRPELRHDFGVTVSVPDALQNGRGTENVTRLCAPRCST